MHRPRHTPVSIGTGGTPSLSNVATSWGSFRGANSSDVVGTNDASSSCVHQRIWNRFSARSCSTDSRGAGSNGSTSTR